MESAKNQTLSHNSSPESDTFKPYEPPPSEPPPSDTLKEMAQGISAFRVPSDFWTSLLSDSWIRKEVESIIDQRVSLQVKETVERELGSLRETTEKEAAKKGYEDGLEKGKTETTERLEKEFAVLRKGYEAKMESLLNRTNLLAIQVLNEKKKILQDHEKIWCQALRDLLEKFQVKSALNLSAAVEDWIGERMNEFGKVESLKVFLSPKEYPEALKETQEMKAFPWEFYCDDTLTDGQARIECGDGGFLFSRKDGTARLDEWLNRYFGHTGVELEVNQQIVEPNGA